jgi:diguanylate cyclase
VSAAPLPNDEMDRLAALRAYHILDTPPEVAFDALTQLAAEYFKVPISLISLVDADRQWFKASKGLAATETPRAASFCAHAILRPDEIMVVENASLDPRFADNPMVCGDPSIRFYAGAPIRAENGQALGTLCIMDRKSRQIGAAGRRFLTNLASNVASMLELHRKNLVLATMSGRDPLTGLANRRIFDTELASACSGASVGVPFGLLMLDLDDFKEINDRFGHAVGDSLLREVGQRLNQAVRAGDLVARLGGDEFAVVVAGPVDLDGLRQLAQRLMAAFLTDMPHHPHTVPIRTSIGLALAPVHGTEPRILSRAADLALYRAKRAGRRMFSVATTSDDAAAAAMSLFERELRQAIAGRTLALHWQPCVSLHSGAVIGHEALLRWHPPGLGPVSPVDIISHAEKFGLIAALDEMVVRRACIEAASWPRPDGVSVNLAAWWFNNGDLVGLVGSALTDSGLAPSRLTIELTEGTLVQHTDHARQRIANLRKMGVRVALDNFGVGYASLACLSSFELDEVKLDRVFVQGLGSNPRAQAVARAVIALGRALGLAVCAEGVETLDQLRFLRAAGCDTAQGFLLARPQAEIAWSQTEDPGPWAAALLEEPAAAA